MISAVGNTVMLHFLLGLNTDSIARAPHRPVFNNIYLAGGFGSFINPQNACRIGLLPKNMEEKIIKVGNGAEMGAKAYLLDQEKYHKLHNILQNGCNFYQIVL